MRGEAHQISIVIPVYRGEQSLPGLVDEILPLTSAQVTPAGHRFVVGEVLLVWDNGPDHSDMTIRALAQRHEVVRPVWLSRNFGQHPATMAGLASAGGDWIVTMDEDGQHDPRDIALLLDTALAEQAGLVYAAATNPPPHGAVRNAASRLAKRFLTVVMGTDVASSFHSFRLMLGETGRALAAYAGPGVYLDVALSWLVRRTATCPVAMRSEVRDSSYSFGSLASHFRRMVVTSGTRGLRLVTFTGIGVGVLGVLLSLVVVVNTIIDPAPVAGWTSLICVLLIGLGLLLASLGVVAEYLGVAVSAAMGRPLYLVVSDPAAGPLGRSEAATPVLPGGTTQEVASHSTPGGPQPGQGP